MATLSVAGIGSGLDVNSLLEQIVAAERTPTENRLNLKEATLQAELTAFGSIKGAVSSFQSSLGKLKDPAFFNSSDVSVSNTDILTATTSSVASTGNYSVQVNSLAQSHTLASIGFDSFDDVIGNGTLTFNFGTTDYDPGTDYQTGDDSYNGFTVNSERSSQSIVIDNTNNTMAGIRDAINVADIGVHATIVDDGSGYRLLLTSESQGADNSLQVTVNEGGAAGDNIDMTGLSVLAFNANATNAEQTQQAQDASLSVNGLLIRRESNTVTGAIHGVTLNLLDAQPGQTVQVSVSSNNIDEAKTNISAFVDAFNELANTMKDLTAYDPETGQGGVLTGDSTARNIMQQIRRELNSLVNNGGQYNSLSAIGITTNRDGTLSLNAGKLETALNDDFDAVSQLFYASGAATDPNVTYVSGSPFTQDGNYRVYIDQLATQGQLRGDQLTLPITIDNSNDSFSLLVDNVSTGLVHINQGTYSDFESLAAQIQTRINSTAALQNAGATVEVEFANGQLNIRSGLYGAASLISLSVENASLGLTANSTETQGQDVVGSIGGQSASGGGRTLIGTGTAAGLTLQVEGTTTGNRGSVSFSSGVAGRLDGLLNQFLASNGQLETKTGTLEDQISEIDSQRAALDKRVAQIEAQYRDQFTALDVLMGQLQTTSQYLQQQLDALQVIGKSGNN